MNISVSTANFYYRPFNETLEIIAEAGFKSVELTIYWKNERWEIAQHLQDLSARKVIRSIENYDLLVSTIHDPSGVALDKNSAPRDVISPFLKEILQEIPESSKCIIFHTPHIKGDQDLLWWSKFSLDYANYLNSYKEKDNILTIETMPSFEDYYVPLINPLEYKTFAMSNNLGITLDTTHCAQEGIDITDAVKILGNNIKTIHLSDFKNGKSHIFFGDGILNWGTFFNELDYSELYSITLECSMSSKSKDAMEMTKEELISRLIEAKSRLEYFLH